MLGRKNILVVQDSLIFTRMVLAHSRSLWRFILILDLLEFPLSWVDKSLMSSSGKMLRVRVWQVKGFFQLLNSALFTRHIQLEVRIT